MKDKKIIPPSQIPKLVAKLRRQGKKIVTTNGAFDMLHVGHIRFLKNVKTFGDVMIVGLNSDSSIQKNKGPNRPVIPLKFRLEMLATLPFVDYVTYFSEGTPVGFLKMVKPKIHVKDTGYKISEIKERPLIESFGGKVVLIPYTKEISTTKIIEKIKKG